MQDSSDDDRSVLPAATLKGFTRSSLATISTRLFLDRDQNRLSHVMAVAAQSVKVTSLVILPLLTFNRSLQSAPVSLPAHFINICAANDALP